MKWKIFTLVLFFFFSLAFTPLLSQAATTTIQASKVNFAQNNAATDNNGTNTKCALDPASSFLYRCFLSFSISSLPASSSISAATLSIYYYSNNGDPVGKSLDLYRLTRNDWSETTSSWNNYTTGTSWTLAGGDKAYPTASSTVPAGFGWVTFNATSLVQDAYASTTNVNALIKYTLENIGAYPDFYYEFNFYSNDYVTDSSLQPKLDITYTSEESEESSDSSSTLPIVEDVLEMTYLLMVVGLFAGSATLTYLAVRKGDKK